MRYLVFLLSLLSACSFNPKAENTIKSKQSAVEPFFVSSVLIYLLDKESISLASISEHEDKLLKQFREVENIPDSILIDGYQIKVVRKGDDEFMEPGITLLHDTFLHLSEKETQGLENAERAIQLNFFGTKDTVIKKQQSISEFIYAIAKSKNVVVVDLNTFEFYNPPLWKKNRVDPFREEIINITSQVIIHTYREDEFCRAVTLGMNKFCLPEISIKNFTCSDQNVFGNLINATIQTLAEDPFIYENSTLTIDLKKIGNSSIREFLLDGAKTGTPLVASIKLKSVEPEEGDNYGSQLLIAFENQKFASPQEEQNQLIANLFGVEESFTYANHDKELLKASENARLRLPELKKIFNEGLAPGYSIMVKRPFETDDGGNEWMWVEVTKWTNEEMQGILQNDPYEISDLKAGAAVRFNEIEIFDYILNKPDGSFEGNETGKILESRN